MKRNIIILAIVIAVIGAIFFFTKGGFSGSPVVNKDGAIKGDYSLQSIIALNTPYECSFSKGDASSNIAGAVRIAEGKARADFDIEIKETELKSFASHLLIRDNLAYVWTSIQPTGFKGKIAESTEKNASPAEQAQIIGLKDKINYTCSPWNLNLTVFEIPSGITFLDLK